MAVYIVNKRGKLRVDNVDLIIDETSQIFKDYLSFIKGGGIPTLMDFTTELEKNGMVEILRKQYSDKISNIPGLREAVERVAFGEAINPDIVAKREALKAEFQVEKNKILAL